MGVGEAEVGPMAERRVQLGLGPLAVQGDLVAGHAVVWRSLRGGGELVGYTWLCSGNRLCGQTCSAPEIKEGEGEMVNGL